MTFLGEPAESEGQQALYAGDVRDDGYVWDVSRLWGHAPELRDVLVGAFDAASRAAGLGPRDKAMLVLGTATTLGDSYCSIAWSRNLTGWADAGVVRAVLTDGDGDLTDRERALLQWARSIAADPNATTPRDVDELRRAGFSDPEILALTLYGALRLAFSMTNDALGARPDLALAETLEPSVRALITWGRPPA